MDFALSEDLEMFRKNIRKFLDNEGQTEVARTFIKGNTEVLDKTLSGLAELGTTAVNIPENNDGLGLGTVALVPIFEELGRALLPGSLLETLAFTVPLIEKYGTEEQKERYLSEIASGSRTVTLAWLELHGDYSPLDVQCEAKQNGDKFVISGVKELVPNLDSSDTLLTVLRTSDSNGKEGISLMLIDKEDDIQIEAQQSIDETIHLGKVTFNGFHVTKDQLLGEVDKGWDLLEEGLLHLNAAIASEMTGGIEKIVETVTEYANIREQFGGPIGRFQAVKHSIVNLKADLESARSLSYYAAWALEHDAEGKEAAIYSARSFATTAFIKAASDNIQLHGGIGFTEEMDCHLYLKRARFYENYVGSDVDFNEHIASALGW